MAEETVEKPVMEQSQARKKVSIKPPLPPGEGWGEGKSRYFTPSS